jgi:acyl-CoA thioester hydrolase
MAQLQEAAARLRRCCDDAAFTWPVRVYWEDTDAGGIVFYANYLKFFERARTEWLRSLGVRRAAARETGGIFVVSETSCATRAGALDDELLVTAELEDGRGSLIIASRPGAATPAGEGTIRIGWVERRPAAGRIPPPSSESSEANEPRPVDPATRAGRQPGRAARDAAAAVVSITSWAAIFRKLFALRA